MTGLKYDVTAAAVSTLFRGGGEFNEPARILNDLSAEEATRAIPGSPYTIATLVAHLFHWQQTGLNQSGLSPDAPVKAEHIEDSFPNVAPEEWESVRNRFLNGVTIAENLTAEYGASASRQNKDTSVAYDLAETALHNAYHLGQIVLLRRMAGLWPPKDGDANDW